MQKVFVIDADNKPLLPCHPARARRLLGEGRADVEQVVPFTIKLKRSVDNPVGSFTVGIDDGAKHVGIAVVNDKTNEVVFKGQIDLRQDVSRLVEQRRNYRRARRYRKSRCRKPRFDNRIGCKIPPSIRCRKDSILRFVADMSKRVKITKAVVEEVKFNHAICRHGKWFSLVEIGKNYLLARLPEIGLSVEVIGGFMTKEWRTAMGLSKRHSHDAIAMICRGTVHVMACKEWLVKPRRTKVWMNNPTKTCEEKNGFRHYDIVKAAHQTRGQVIGSIRSLKKAVITLRTKFNDNFAVSYRKSRLLWRPRGLIYLAT
jgi:hypothetical protein